MKEIYFTYITYWINFFKGKPKHIALKQNLITTLLQTYDLNVEFNADRNFVCL